MLEMMLTVPNVAGQLSLPLGQAQRKCARQMCRTTRDHDPGRATLRGGLRPVWDFVG